MLQSRLREATSRVCVLVKEDRKSADAVFLSGVAVLIGAPTCGLKSTESRNFGELRMIKGHKK